MRSDKVIFTNGCFDVIHAGHVQLLEYCASLGRVTVGINSDKSVRRLKGSGRPINTQKDRTLILSAFKFVEQVIVFDEDTPYELIQELRPDIIVKGGDYQPEGVVGGDIAEVRIFPYLEGRSTTEIIRNLGRLAD